MYLRVTACAVTFPEVQRCVLRGFGGFCCVVWAGKGGLGVDLVFLTMQLNIVLIIAEHF